MKKMRATMGWAVGGKRELEKEAAYRRQRGYDAVVVKRESAKGFVLRVDPKTPATIGEDYFKITDKPAWLRMRGRK